MYLTSHDVMDNYKSGDRVYCLEKNAMALCRIRKIVQDKSDPDTIRCTFEIVEEPSDHEYLKPLGVLNPSLVLVNSFTLTFGPEYAPYGMQLYSPEEFEKYYGHFQVKMAPWAQGRAACLLALILVVVLIIGACLVSINLVFRG